MWCTQYSIWHFHGSANEQLPLLIAWHTLWTSSHLKMRAYEIWPFNKHHLLWQEPQRAKSIQTKQKANVPAGVLNSSRGLAEPRGNKPCCHVLAGNCRLSSHYTWAVGISTTWVLKDHHKTLAWVYSAPALSINQNVSIIKSLHFFTKVIEQSNLHSQKIGKN